MSYDAKTNWTMNDPVTEVDINRWEQGIKDAHEQLNEVSSLTLEQLRDTRLNLLALGVAVQNLQASLLYGITSYFVVEDFRTLDKVTLYSGMHDPLEQKIYLP